MRAVIRHLRAAALCCKGDGPGDGQLLEAFLLRREETAFEALARRHGPMVFGVCRRILQNVHDAEDAFQATFLVLARKAATVKPREMVGNWLYGVAYRTAMKSRAMRLKRQAKERQVAELSHVQAPAGEASEELLTQLDHELNRLADRYRVPVVLCELQGRSRKEAARMLGIPEGTLSSRLAQAKKLLARKLSRYGTLSVAALLAQSAASAGLPSALRASLLKMVFSAEAVSANVLALTEGMMKAMLLTKLKLTVCAATLLLAAGVGATGLTYRATAQQPRQETAQANRLQADELEALRLEFEAMRKSLQATRQRVKVLEEEVRTLKSGNRTPATRSPGGRRPGSQQAKPTGELSSLANNLPRQPGDPRSNGSPATTAPSAPEPKPDAGSNSANPFTKLANTAPDPLAHAEEALKVLRTNPKNTKAVEVLERALKQLKEQDKPNAPGKQNPGSQ